LVSKEDTWGLGTATLPAKVNYLHLKKKKCNEFAMPATQGTEAQRHRERQHQALRDRGAMSVQCLQHKAQRHRGTERGNTRH